MAMVFQDHAPYPHLRVRDNLALPLRLAGLPAGEVAERVRTVADQLQLTVHLDRWPSQLSGGQRQRVALGRVLVRPAPAAYLLDEPLSADPALRGRLRAMVAGTTTVWVTPDVAEAAAVGDRVAVLRDGRLAQLGSRAGPGRAPGQPGRGRAGPADRAARLDRGRVAAAADRHAADRPAGPGLGAGRDPAGRPAPGRRRGAAHAAGRRRRRSSRTGPCGCGTRRCPGRPSKTPRSRRDVLARVDPAGRRAVPVVLDPARVLLFDPETGAAL